MHPLTLWSSSQWKQQKIPCYCLWMLNWAVGTELNSSQTYGCWKDPSQPEHQSRWVYLQHSLHGYKCESSASLHQWDPEVSLNMRLYTGSGSINTTYAHIIGWDFAPRSPTVLLRQQSKRRCSPRSSHITPSVVLHRTTAELSPPSSKSKQCYFMIQWLSLVCVWSKMVLHSFFWIWYLLFNTKHQAKLRKKWSRPTKCIASFWH